MEVITVAPGMVLGARYELLEPHAIGAMGEVWRAMDPVLGRIVAVKVLLPGLSADPGFVERFQAEARAMASLSDPSIVEVYDYGQTAAISYLVMRLVEGESLHALLGRVGPLPPREVMTIVAQAAHALHQAHRNGIVHRDVKPSNLVVRPDGHLVLTDFGIADGVAALPAAVIGTAGYLAPEQLAGGPALPATDVYSLGVVAYECLTMRQPIAVDGPLAGASAHGHDHPTPLPDSVPATVQHVVMRALAPEAKDRWPSAEAMAEAASQAARELPVSPWVGVAPVPRPGASPAPTAVLPGNFAGASHRPGPRLWLMAAVAGVATLLVAIGIALSGFHGPALPPASPGQTAQPGNGAGPLPASPSERDGDNSGHGGDGSGHGRG
jgi:serine/threonine-protein kinase